MYFQSDYVQFSSAQLRYNILRTSNRGVGGQPVLEGISVPGVAKESTERPNAPSVVTAFMSVHSKTPYITPSMDVYSGKVVARGRCGQQQEFAWC